MKRLVLVLLLVSAAPPPAEHKVNAAFRAAFGNPDSVLLKKQGQLKEDVKYTPGDLVDTPFDAIKSATRHCEFLCQSIGDL